jgi:hypothetical protein
MSEQANRPQHLFVVRLWQEPSRAAPPGQWRGSVEHVPSGERIYFCALADLAGFIARQMDGQPVATACQLEGQGG